MSETKDFVTIQTNLLNQAKELASNPWHSWRLWIHLVIQSFYFSRLYSLLFWVIPRCVRQSKCNFIPKYLEKNFIVVGQRRQLQIWFTPKYSNFIPKSSKFLYQWVAYFLSHMCQTKQVQLYPKIFRKTVLSWVREDFIPKYSNFLPKSSEFLYQ